MINPDLGHRFRALTTNSEVSYGDNAAAELRITPIHRLQLLMQPSIEPAEFFSSYVLDWHKLFGYKPFLPSPVHIHMRSPALERWQWWVRISA